MTEAAPGPPAMPSRPVMLYDGTCGFCTWSAEQALSRLPRRVDWEPYQTADLGRYGLSRAEVEASIHLVEPTGRLSHGATAVARLLQLCGPPWSWLGHALLVPPLWVVAEAGYRLVSAVRHHLPGSTPALTRPPGERPGRDRHATQPHARGVAEDG